MTKFKITKTEVYETKDPSNKPIYKGDSEVITSLFNLPIKDTLGNAAIIQDKVNNDKEILNSLVSFKTIHESIKVKEVSISAIKRTNKVTTNNIDEEYVITCTYTSDTFSVVCNDFKTIDKNIILISCTLDNIVLGLKINLEEGYEILLDVHHVSQTVSE